ncbi:MAG: hypothetical protein IPM25_06900 [Chloracidobacterium sp.]|nr:hypothetical protein [Chloracidobacterium sp.]
MNGSEPLSNDGKARGRLQLRRSAHAFCLVCSKQVELISFDRAAELFHTDLQDIEFLAKAGSIHKVHNRKGKVLACINSLFECFDNRRTRLLDSSIIKEMAAKNSP